MEIDINCDSIRRRSAFSSKASLRNLSISLSTSSVPYHQHIEMNNDLPEVESWELIDSSQLSYEGDVEVGYSVSMATNKLPPKKEQCVQNKIQALKTISKL